MSDMVFKWASGSRVKISAKIAGPELERIRVEHNGRLTPENLLEAARKPSSPLHAAFNWNDKTAGQSWRLEQAKYLIRSIVVEVKRSKGKVAPIRAFVNVRRDKDRSYTSIGHAMADKDLKAQVVAKAWQELQDWRRRYENLSAFARVFSAIDKLTLPKAKRAA